MATERKFTKENLRRVLVKEFMMKETERAGFGGIDIQRTPMGTRIGLVVERPGLVIGRRGSAINKLTETIQNYYGFYNPQIEVKEDKRSALNAKIMAQKVAFSLERGWHFRRVGHSTVKRIMDAGARGCEILIAGKLTGQRHRTEKFKEGHIKFCGYPAEIFMDKGYSVAKKKLGTIGVTVMIMKPDAKLPAEIEVLDRPLGEVAEIKDASEEADSVNDEKPEEKPKKGQEKKPAKKPAKKATSKKETKPKEEKAKSSEPAKSEEQPKADVSNNDESEGAPIPVPEDKSKAVKEEE